MRAAQPPFPPELLADVHFQREERDLQYRALRLAHERAGQLWSKAESDLAVIQEKAAQAKREHKTQLLIHDYRVDECEVKTQRAKRQAAILQMRLDSLGEDEYYLKASQDCLITELESQQQERRALQARLMDSQDALMQAHSEAAAAEHIKEAILKRAEKAESDRATAEAVLASQNQEFEAKWTAREREHQKAEGEWRRQIEELTAHNALLRNQLEGRELAAVRDAQQHGRDSTEQSDAMGAVSKLVAQLCSSSSERGSQQQSLPCLPLSQGPEAPSMQMQQDTKAPAGIPAGSEAQPSDMDTANNAVGACPETEMGLLALATMQPTAVTVTAAGKKGTKARSRKAAGSKAKPGAAADGKAKLQLEAVGEEPKKGPAKKRERDSGTVACTEASQQGSPGATNRAGLGTRRSTREKQPPRPFWVLSPESVVQPAQAKRTAQSSPAQEEDTAATGMAVRKRAFTPTRQAEHTSSVTGQEAVVPEEDPSCDSPAEETSAPAENAAPQQDLLLKEAAAHERRSGRPIGISKIDLQTVWGGSSDSNGNAGNGEYGSEDGAAAGKDGQENREQVQPGKRLEGKPLSALNPRVLDAAAARRQQNAAAGRIGSSRRSQSKPAPQEGATKRKLPPRVQPKGKSVEDLLLGAGRQFKIPKLKE